MTSNKKKKFKYFAKKIDPHFEDKWIIYEDILKTNLSKDIIWIDIGCGENGNIYEFGKLTKFAVGIDLNCHEDRYNAPFVKGNIILLPLKTNSVDLITLRFVVEHIKDMQTCISEIARVLKNNGKLMILTTNSYNPSIFLLNLLPFFCKNYLIQKVSNIDKPDIFPTYHKMNSPRSFKKKIKGLQKIHQIYLQDVIYKKGWLFLLSFFLHLVTKINILKTLRSNIIAIYQKYEY